MQIWISENVSLRLHLPTWVMVRQTGLAAETNWHWSAHWRRFNTSLNKHFKTASQNLKTSLFAAFSKFVPLLWFPRIKSSCIISRSFPSNVYDPLSDLSLLLSQPGLIGGLTGLQHRGLWVLLSWDEVIQQSGVRAINVKDVLLGRVPALQSHLTSWF